MSLTIRRRSCAAIAIGLLSTALCATGALAQPTGGGSGGAAEALPTETGPRIAAKFIDAKPCDTDGANLQVRRGECFVFEVPGAGDALVRYTLTTQGGTVYSASLLKEQYTREPLAPLAGQDAIPKGKIDGGPIDVVSTWSDVYLPFHVQFGELSYAEPIVRVLRRESAGRIAKGSLQVPAERAAMTVDRVIPFVNGAPVDGLTVEVTAPESVKGTYKIKSVGPGGSIEPEPAFPVADVEGVAYEVQRSALVDKLYASDLDFVRVSEPGAFPVTYVWPDPAVDTSPVFIEKTFDTGTHPYELMLDVVVRNFGDKQLGFRSGLRLAAWQHPDSSETSMFARPTNLWSSTCFTDNTLEQYQFPQLHENVLEGYQNGQGTTFTQVFPTPTHWVSVDTTYFMVAAIPATRGPTGQCIIGMQVWPNGGAGSWVQTSTYMTTTKSDLVGDAGGCLPSWMVGKREGVSCDEAYRTLGLPPGAAANAIDTAWANKRGDQAADDARNALRGQRFKAYRYHLYMGPKDVAYLDATAPTLKESLSLGIFGFIAKPLHSLLVWFHGGVGSWALAIILLTLLIKLVTLPLTNKSYKSMQKMQHLKPKLEELKAKYGSDRQTYAKEQMALFKREGVNPLTGCLPMLLQMPIWFALYTTIYSSVELYHAPMGLWIDDLSAPDPFYILPIILGGLMFVQTFLTTSTATIDGMQGKILKFGMPIMFSVFMLFLPSGLVLYILVNVSLTIVQNLIIRRRIQTP